MTKRKPEDVASSQIEWGIELETFIPENCEVEVGNYHVGKPVVSAVTPDRVRVLAPVIGGNRWRADRDGSIQHEPHTLQCEFVSPVLKGDGGLTVLRDFIQFATMIGAKVNKSCGVHITLGIRSVTGSGDADAIARFVRRLSRVVNKHAWAIYAQTGTDRHNTSYAAPFGGDVGELTNNLTKCLPDTNRRATIVNMCGRGIVNFRKSFHADPAKSAVEFRAFAGTLNEGKLLHHIATCFGLARRAWTTQHVPPFGPVSNPPSDAVDALKRLWNYLGWYADSPGVDYALGQFGELHTSFPDYSEEALKMARKFERRFPKANPTPRQNPEQVPW